MSKKVSFINMTGNKKKLIEEIFSLLGNTYCKTNYIEPFFGSGGAYCNLPVEFDNYQCSDIFPFIIDFLNANYDSETLATFFEGVMKRWDIQNSKEDYYRFREYWNLNKEKSEKFKNIGFVMLANACINNMVRFGPNGFNQSYGNRSISKEKLCGLYSLVRPNTIFEIEDFRHIIYTPGAFVYLDPPYSGTGAMTSMHGFYEWSSREDKELLEIINTNKKEAVFVLSTIDGSALEKTLTSNNFSKFFIDSKKYKVTPWAFGAKDYKEIILTNIHAL